MCKEHDECGDCALREMADKADIYCPIQTMRKLDAAKVEAAVMDWAAKHPEPRYPTWKEWQDTNFPNNDALMRPCIFESEEYFNCKQEIGCEKCVNKPIPADIAEKLGVKPIGGTSDENA